MADFNLHASSSCDGGIARFCYNVKLPVCTTHILLLHNKTVLACMYLILLYQYSSNLINKLNKSAEGVKFIFQ